MSAPVQYQQVLGGIRDNHPLLGLAMLHHRTIRGAPMFFKNRPFQVEQYSEFPTIPGADIVKAVQTGQSEMFTIMGLHDAGWKGRIFAYVLPTDGVRNRFVSTRINPLLAVVPEYRKRLPGIEVSNLEGGDSGSLKQKRFGQGLLLFLGARTDGNFVELTADTFVVDEYDTSHAMGPHNLERVVDRMKESPDPRHFRLGNPELPGGISALFEQGDMRLFHWICSHCNEWQPIDWTNNVVDQADDGSWVIRDPVARKDKHSPIRPVCRKCGRPFERDNERCGWVPEQLLRERRSYRMTRFDVMTEPLRNLWTEWVAAQASTMKLREWYRRNAGLLYRESSAEVTEQQLREACCLPRMDYSGGPEYRGRAITAGIDVGALFHVKVSETVRAEAGHVERRMVWTGTVRTKDQVLDILQRYRVRTVVIDQDPETRIVEEMQEAARRFSTHTCTVWLCRFHKQPRSSEFDFGITPKWKTHEVRVDRTQVFDVATEHIHAGAAYGRIHSRGEPVGKTIDGIALYCCDATDVLGWLAQMEAPKRMTNAKGRIVWDEGDKEDHFRLADVYDLVAYTLDGMGAVVFEL